MSVDIQIVSKHPISSHGTTQLRCNQPAEYLREAGYTVSVETIYQTWPKARKLIFAHRITLNAYTRDFLTCAHARGCPVIYDTDDLLFDPDGLRYLRAGQKAVNYERGSEPYAQAIAACDAVSVSTGFLQDRTRLLNPHSHVLLNALSASYLALSDQVFEARKMRDTETVTLAYLSGSKSHDADFKVAEPGLLEILETYPNVRLVLVGALSISSAFDKFTMRVERRAFVPYDSYASIFEDIDINLIPLEIEQPFCHAKSELKFIEAGACGVVSVASPTEPHKAVIAHGENGYLAEGASWVETLSALIESSDLRERTGQAARDTVLKRYTNEARSKDYAAFVSTLLAEVSVTKTGFTEAQVAAARLHLTRTKRAARRKLSNLRATFQPGR